MLVAVFANALYGVLLRRWAFVLPIWEQMLWQILAATLVRGPIWLAGPISPITAHNLPLILYAATPASLRLDVLHKPPRRRGGSPGGDSGAAGMADRQAGEKPGAGGMEIRATLEGEEMPLDL
jgi:hypothetical protein